MSSVPGSSQVIYKCNCTQICRGENRIVPQATYYRHKPFRQEDERRRQAAWYEQHNPTLPEHEPIRPSKRHHSSERGSSKRPCIDTSVQSAAPPDPPGPVASTSASVILGDHSIHPIDDPEPAPDVPELSSPTCIDAALHEPTTVLDLDPGSIADDSPWMALLHELPPSDDVPRDPEPSVHVRARPQSPSPEPEEEASSAIQDIQTALDFIKSVRNATLDDSGLSTHVVERLRNPITHLLEVKHPDLLYSLDLWLSINNASQETYHAVRQASLRRHPKDPVLSFAQVERQVIELTGIAPLHHDMCIDSCVAYTGPFAALDHCPVCDQPRYDPIVLQTSHGRIHKPRQRFSTIPLGPQLQTLWRSPELSQQMRHRTRRTNEILAQLEHDHGEIDTYDDIYHGQHYLDAVQAGRIGHNDVLLAFSIDGAQLYRNKTSDCWIYIWINLNLPPDIRYKKERVLIGGVIPGPNHPQNLDSFVQPGLAHLSALQQEGLHIWDASSDTTNISTPILSLLTADGPGLTTMSGGVPHHGFNGCRMRCGLEGRHKPQASHYFAAHACPREYPLARSDHADVSFSQLRLPTPAEYLRDLEWLQSSQNAAQYRYRRKHTGLVKPTILSGLHGSFGVPGIFVIDLMHLASLNITDLFLSLWRGSLECDKADDKDLWDWAVLQGDIWRAHGDVVAQATPYLPGSFDRPPRNPCEKISSGYKAWEFLLYFYVLGPAIFRGVLPDKYWRHYCKLVAGIRILHQRAITRAQLVSAHTYLTEFIQEFEQLYYQRLVSRLHFCRQSIHLLWHLAQEVVRVGPPAYYTQWTMERTIGNLGEEIKQPSKPYANLSERAVRRAQTGALKAAVPQLASVASKWPRGSLELEHGYALLRARDRSQYTLTPREAVALLKYYQEHNEPYDMHTWSPKTHRWARLALPTGQNARSAWKETLKPLEKLRTSRNIKAHIAGRLEFGEVRYFFVAPIGARPRALAMISQYTRPDGALLTSSVGTVYSCEYRGDDALLVIDIHDILSVVAVIPEPVTAQAHSGRPQSQSRFFVAEKLGLEVADLGGIVEDVLDGENDEYEYADD